MSIKMMIHTAKVLEKLKEDVDTTLNNEDIIIDTNSTNIKYNGTTLIPLINNNTMTLVTTASSTMIDNAINSIVSVLDPNSITETTRVNKYPDNSYDKYTISSEGSEVPIIAWQNTSDFKVYYYSQATVINFGTGNEIFQ